MKPVVFRQPARQDIDEAADYYVDEAGAAVATAFAEAVADTIARISFMPGGGSKRWGEQLGLVDLRSRNVRRFPYIVFYLDGAEQVEIWRVLHAQRDLPNDLNLTLD